MENLIPIGTISKVHGYKGLVKAEINSSEVGIEKNQTVFIEINKKPVPFLVEEIKNNEKDCFIKFDDIENSVEAEEIVGLQIFINSEKKYENDENYRNIIGYKVIDQNNNFIGNVASIIERSAQDLLEICHDEKSFFLPCVKQIIIKINHKQKSIFTDIPEGIISIND